MKLQERNGIHRYFLCFLLSQNITGFLIFSFFGFPQVVTTLSSSAFDPSALVSCSLILAICQLLFCNSLLYSFSHPPILFPSLFFPCIRVCVYFPFFSYFLLFCYPLCVLCIYFRARCTFQYFLCSRLLHVFHLSSFHFSIFACSRLLFPGHLVFPPISLVFPFSLLCY